MTQPDTLARSTNAELSATRQMPAYINGPWVAETRDGSLYRIYAHADPDREIACIYSTRETAETDRANANAITQTPELLQLVREALGYFTSHESEIDIRDWMKSARAVLARADSQ